ncbi:MAG: site-2 protease family protein [Planctomycetaceae bacterium]|nr:site-2 protease family protein [Planctomycetaceae bacterium]
MFGAPPPTSFDIRFVLFRIPVTVTPFFWILACLLGYLWSQDSSENSSGLDPFHFVAVVLAVFLSILTHEMGHALVIRNVFGAAPAVFLHGLGGVAVYDPIYYYRKPGRWGSIFISFAGPLAGFILSAISYLALVYFLEDTRTYLGFFLWVLFIVGFFWGILNLMPIYPLDGGQIFREICLMVSPKNGLHASLIVSAGVGFLLTLLALGRGDFFIAVLFGVLAYQSVQMLQTRRF